MSDAPFKDRFEYYLERSFACACDYDLRGLKIIAECPECGRSISDQVIGAQLDLTDKRRSVARKISADQLTAIAKHCEVSLPTLNLYLSARDFVNKQQRRDESGAIAKAVSPEAGVTASQICRACALIAMQTIKDDSEGAAALLAAYGFSSCDDVGEFLSKLVNGGVSRWDRPDERTEFRGPFDFSPPSDFELLDLPEDE